ncbi:MULTISPECIES: hypothetical protein [Actinomyces]|uniref:Uncharacterized protein n=1 Tax=Actinomyces oris TaxID=544580 RepID=A0AAW9KWY1_9ACTO|nr:MULTISPECIES: hypothetical protein [Actinomyces]MEA1304505.1 hypothetical protein [Actinomyces oris]
MAVLHQVEGLVEVALDQGGVCCIAGEGTVELGQLAGQAVLFFCEQFQGDGSGVLGLEQAAALGFQLAAAYAQGADVFVGVGLDAAKFGLQVAGDLLAVFGGEGDGMVEVGHALFDLVNQDGAKVTGVQAVAAGADEVAVDVAAPGGGVLDQQA